MAWRASDRQRDPCGRRHESRLPRVGDAGTRRACSRHGQPKGSRLTLPKPRDQCLSHVVARRTALRASVSPGEGKVSPRRWERAHEQKRYLTWAAEMMPAVHARRALQGCDCACWASTPAYEHSQIDRRQEAQQRRSLSPLSCACLAGSTVRGHPRLCARVLIATLLSLLIDVGFSLSFFLLFWLVCCEQGLRLRHWTLG